MKKLEKEFMKNFINPLFADYLNEKRAMEKTKVLNKKRKKMIDQSNDRFNGIFGMVNPSESWVWGSTPHGATIKRWSILPT